MAHTLLLQTTVVMDKLILQLVPHYKLLQEKHFQVVLLLAVVIVKH